MKKFLALCITLITLLATTALAQTVAFFNPIGNNDYTAAAEKGVREVLEGAGMTVESFDAGFNAEEQLNQIEDAITSGNFDAFVLYSVDGVGVTVGVDAAVEAGIPVISLDAPIGEDRTTLVPYKNVAAQIARTGAGDGAQIGTAIVSACEGDDDCQVAFMIGFQGFPLDLDRFNAVEAIVAGHDNISIVANQAASYLEDEGFDVATDMLQANSDIDVIASVGDQMILGAELAVQDAGLEGQVALIGQGGNQDAYNAVAEGRWFATIANIPYTNGKIAGQMAQQVLEGNLITVSANMYDQSPPYPASGAIITQDNYEDFSPEW